MQTKYKILLMGTGILIGGMIYLLSSKQSRDNDKITKSLDSTVEREQSDLQYIFGDMPYVPKEA